MTFLFGPLAGGLITGLNFGRLGRKGVVGVWMVVGAIIFIFEAAPFTLNVSDGALRPYFVSINVAAGLGFMLAQKVAFDHWKASNWRPTMAGGKYRPNRTGLLFMVGLACLAVEIGLILLLILSTGK